MCGWLFQNDETSVHELSRPGGGSPCTRASDEIRSGVHRRGELRVFDRVCGMAVDGCTVVCGGQACCMVDVEGRRGSFGKGLLGTFTRGSLTIYAMLYVSEHGRSWDMEPFSPSGPSKIKAGQN